MVRVSPPKTDGVQDIFVDTSALYALANVLDPHHEAAARFVRENATPLVASSVVFVETVSLISKRISKAHAVKFGTRLRGSRWLVLHEITDLLHEQAWELFAGHRHERFDMVDATSFVLMKALGVTRAFTFDRDFRAQGFAVVP